MRNHRLPGIYKIKQIALILVVALIAALALSACGDAATSTPVAGATTQANGNSTTVPAAGSNGKQVTLEFWTAFPEWQKFVQDAAKIYSEKNPNVKVNVTLFPQRALEDKVAVALPAGEGPDLLELDKLVLYPYYINGQLEVLPSNAVEYVKKSYPKEAIETVTSPKGDMFTFPWAVSVKMMFYNKDYFKEAGLTEPPKDIYQMLEYGKKLTKHDAKGQIERAGFDLRLSGGAFGTSQKYWTQVMAPLNVPVIEKVGDKWKAGYDTDKGREALKYYIDAVYKYKVDSIDFKSDAEAFGLGLTAMFQRESWVVGTMYDQYPKINFDVFQMPKGPDGTWATVGNTMGLSVPKASKNKDEAFKFALFLMSDEMSKLMFGTSGWQPWRTNVDYSELYKTRPQLKPFMDALINTPGLKVYDYENIPPIYEIHNRLADRLIAAFARPELLDNPAAIDAAIKDMAKETNQILARDNLLAK
jgi:multiple sugar transport system substrate-binding protein